MNNIATMIVPTVFILLLNGTMCFAARQKFGRCLPVTMMGTVFALYVSQFIFHSFRAGYLVLAVLAVAGPFLMLTGRLYMPKAGLVRGKSAFVGRFADWKSNYFSLGFYAFLSVVLVFVILDFARPFTRWDEVSHWGMMVKEMLRTDRFYSEEVSRLIAHKEYPPFVALFEMLWCKFSGGYSEMGCTLSLHVLCFSLMVPAILDESKLRWNRRGSRISAGFLTLMVFLLVINALDADVVLMTIYNDIFMFVLLAYAMYLVTVKRGTLTGLSYVSFVFALTALVLTKQMGLPLYLMAAVYYVLAMLLSIWERRSRSSHGNMGREKSKKTSSRKGFAGEICKMAAVVFVPFVMYRIWQNYTAGLQLAGQFDLSKISVRAFMDVLLGSNDTLLHDTMVRYVNALFQRPIYDHVIVITFVSSVFVVWLLLAILWWVSEKRQSLRSNEEQTIQVGQQEQYALYSGRRLVLLGVIMTVGTLGYAFTMLVMYLFCYTQAEMIGLSSFNRYMSTFFIGQITLLLMLAFHLFFQGGQGGSQNVRGMEQSGISHGGRQTFALAIVVLLCLVLLSPVGLYNLVPQVLKGNPNQIYQDYAAVLREKTRENDRVFVVCDATMGYSFYMAYYADGREIDDEYYNVLEYDFNDSEVKQRLLEKMEMNDYVYVISTNEGFTNAYSDLVEHGDIAPGQVYQVARDENGFHFIAK